MENDRESAYPKPDDLIGDALRLVTSGVDPDKTAQLVEDAMAGLAKQAKAIKNLNYATQVERIDQRCECGAMVTFEIPALKAGELAKTMAQTAKAIDETARLNQFLMGKPDSRPDALGMPTDVLRALTDEQVGIVLGWVETNARTTQDVSERGPRP